MASSTLSSLFALTFLVIGYSNAQMPGGYSPVDPSDYGDLENEVNTHVIAAGLTNFSRLVKIESAEKQVVAGTNFRITGIFKTKSGSSSRCTIVIYRDLHQNYSVTSSTCKQIK